jgi:hypothetical protein
VCGPYLEDQSHNKNGQRLVTLAEDERLKIANTYFAPRDGVGTGTWEIKSSPGTYKATLDHILVAEKHWNRVRDCRIDPSLTPPTPGFTAYTDHRLTRLHLARHHEMTEADKAALAARRKERRKAAPPGPDFERMRDPIMAQEVTEAVDEAFQLMQPPYATQLTTAQHQGDGALGRLQNDIRTKIGIICLRILGTKQPTGSANRDKDWYAKNKTEMDKLWGEKDAAGKRLYLGRADTNERYRKASNAVKSASRKFQNEHWQEINTEMTTAHDRRDLGSFYGRLQEAYGSKKKAVPGIIGEDGVIFNEDDTLAITPDAQLNRWTQHFKALFNQKGTSALRNIPDTWLPPMREGGPATDLDGPITLNEMTNALGKNKYGKAIGGGDTVPIDVDRRISSPSYLDAVLKMLNAILTTGDVPQEWKDVVITILYKSGDSRNCNNYRGIALTSHLGKTFERILAERLLKHMLKTPGAIPNTQCGFIPGKGTDDAIIMSRVLASLALSKGQNLYTCFVDLQKAYDLVDRGVLWDLLRRRGVPDKMLKAIINFHEGARAQVKVDGIPSDRFDLERGLKQGSAIAALLFNIYMGAAIEATHKELDKDQTLGVQLDTRSSGEGGRNFSFKSMAGCASEKMYDILYADDMQILAHTPEALQDMLNAYDAVLSAYGMVISQTKTKVMVYRPPGAGNTVPAPPATPPHTTAQAPIQPTGAHGGRVPVTAVAAAKAVAAAVAIAVRKIEVTAMMAEGAEAEEEVETGVAEAVVGAVVQVGAEVVVARVAERVIEVEGEAVVAEVAAGAVVQVVAEEEVGAEAGVVVRTIAALGVRQQHPPHRAYYCKGKYWRLWTFSNT